MRPRGVLAMVLLLGTPGALSAQRAQQSQQARGGCGASGDAASVLATFAAALHRPFEVVRDNVPDTIAPVAPDAPAEVLTDEKTCAAVRRAGEERLRSLGQMKAFEETGIQHRVFRVGPYYVISFSQAPPEDPTAPNARLDLAPDFVLFFEVASMRYLGEVLWG